MIKNSFKILVFVLCILLYNNHIYAKDRKKDFKILAYVNEKAVTDADLEAYVKITKNNDPEKALKELVELIQYSEIASKNGIKFDRKDKAEYWSKLRTKFKLDHNKKEFCKKNEIDEKFLDNYIRMLAIWEIYYENYIVKNVSVGMDTVMENMEFTGKVKNENAYELYGVILHYSDDKQKKDIKAKLNNVFTIVKSNKMPFQEAIKPISNSKVIISDVGVMENRGDNYIGWINDSDFNEIFMKEIKNTEIGGITHPICVDGNSKGSCVIFMVNDSKTTTTMNKKDEIITFNDFYKKIIDIKVMETADGYSDILKIKYN